MSAVTSFQVYTLRIYELNPFKAWMIREKTLE